MRVTEDDTVHVGSGFFLKERDDGSTLQNLQQLDQEALTGLLNKLSVLDDPTVDRVVVELRVKQVRDEEAPEDSQVGEATL